jgi:hypothetical protein
MTTPVSQPATPTPVPAGPSDPGVVRAQRLVTSLAAIASAAAVAVTARHWAGGGSAFAQAGCLLAAALWIVAAAIPCWPERRQLRDRVRTTLIAIAVFVLACLLRHRLLGLLPPPDRTGFEEMQMGADGYRILTSGILPLEFRFSKVAAALGLWWGGATVGALRAPFHLMGYARLFALYLCLRGLRVARWPAAVLTVAASAARWFVIGGGVAYEDFSPNLAMQLLLLCVIKVDPVRRSGTAWSAAAGALAGVLAFENSSFRFAIIFAGLWILWLAVASRRRGWPRWRPAVWFLAVGCLVALPMIVDLARLGSGSIFFEALQRYAGERPGILPSSFAASLGQSLAMIAGAPMRISFYLAPEADSAIHPLLGVLLVAGAVVGLLRGPGIVRALVVAAAGAVIVCSASTNFFTASRLSPVLSFLLLPAGVLLGEAGRWLGRALDAVLGRVGLTRRAGSLARLVTVGAYGALAIVIVAASARRVAAMAASPDVWNEYLNDQYVTARYLARACTPGMPVVAVTPGLERNWSREGTAYWVFAGKHPVVSGSTTLPAPASVRAGTLVVLRPEGRPLRAEEIAALRALADATRSAASLELVREHGDRVILGSVCVQCDVHPATGGI